MAGERVFIGMGSNIGNRRQNIESALDMLGESGVVVEKKSSFYETSPVGHPSRCCGARSRHKGADKQRDYLNAAAQCRTELSPQKLIRLVRTIERRLGRIKTEKWGSRTIDLDILFIGTRRIRSRNLTVPHPRIAERKFVLWPLKEIAPRFRPPGHSMTVGLLAKKLTDPSQKVKIYPHG